MSSYGDKVNMFHRYFKKEDILYPVFESIFRNYIYRDYENLERGCKQIKMFDDATIKFYIRFWSPSKQVYTQFSDDLDFEKWVVNYDFSEAEKEIYPDTDLSHDPVLRDIIYLSIMLHEDKVEDYKTIISLMLEEQIILGEKMNLR